MTQLVLDMPSPRCWRESSETGMWGTLRSRAAARIVRIRVWAPRRCRCMPESNLYKLPDAFSRSGGEWAGRCFSPSFPESRGRSLKVEPASEALPALEAGSQTRDRPERLRSERQSRTSHPPFHKTIVSMQDAKPRNVACHFCDHAARRKRLSPELLRMRIDEFCGDQVQVGRRLQCRLHVKHRIVARSTAPDRAAAANYRLLCYCEVQRISASLV